jgi:hypothetical protein
VDGSGGGGGGGGDVVVVTLLGGVSSIQAAVFAPVLVTKHRQ